ncbi:hypothetical protein GCM10022291_24670 [Postechiella marina]|uniref:Universal stress protein n=1 Tax=Postechiella marina TaxID=943941 RepID=A0ABP8CCD6_9FLAO
MKKILIPTDFSKKSYQTINYIVELFKNERCAFYFLNTYTFDAYGLNAIELLQADDDWFDKPQENSLNNLGSLLKKYSGIGTNFRHQYHVISEYATLVKGIEMHIDNLNIDLLVLKGNRVISKNIKDIVDKIRTCPVLIVPPCALVNKTLNLTITSTFKDQVRTFGIDTFLEILKNTNFVINILVLDNNKTLTTEAEGYLQRLINHLKSFSNKKIKVVHTKKMLNLKDYAVSHLNEILCVTDKKPDVFRRVGLSQSAVISTLKSLQHNLVLTIHQ